MFLLQHLKIQLQAKDLLYAFSDGYVDQFGGEKGKKFNAIALMELLKKIYCLPLAEQEATLLKAFNEWKGDLEQVDDICVLGLQI